MNIIYNYIPLNLIYFLLVTLFSLLIGLSQRSLHQEGDESRLFGTDRTFTFIGILGYILFIISPENRYIFTAGGFVLSMFLGVNYYFKILNYKKFGLTTIVIALITYCIAPLIITQPKWLFLLVILTVLVITELKESFSLFSKKFDRHEFITLAKFIAIAGVILPIVPNTPFIPEINITPYKIWLAVVVFSSISYISYLLKKFLFKKSGIVLSGLLGGLYSSTATTVILARKSKESNTINNQYVSSIVFSILMMFIRILILILIFNTAVFINIYPYFLVMIFTSASIGVGILLFKKNNTKDELTLTEDKNPLEFKTALVFTLLFVGFTFLTHYTIEFYGTKGLNVLSLVVGVTDIDPFLINLYQGKYEVSYNIIAISTMLAIISNNILKLFYALIFSAKMLRKLIFIALCIIIIINLLVLLVMVL